MGSPHWPAAILPFPHPQVILPCEYCGSARTPAGMRVQWAAFAYGRRACTTCWRTPDALLETRRLTRWLTFTRTIQRQGPLQRVLAGPAGIRIGHCLHPLLPTLPASRRFITPPDPVDALHRCLGSQLPHTQEHPHTFGAAHPHLHVHPIYSAALRNGAPLLSIGDYVRTRDAPTRTVCRAYTAPPDVCHRSLRIYGGGAYLATLAPGTYLGPIEDLCVSARFVTILVREFWINVWLCSPVGQRGACLALRIPSAEVAMWKAQGWTDWV